MLLCEFYDFVIVIFWWPIVVSCVVYEWFLLLCFEGIANVRCLIIRMILWYNVKDARTGKLLCLFLVLVTLNILAFSCH